MANSNGLAVGLAVGIPSFLIIIVVGIFWYKNQRKLQKEDIDDEFIEKELQNDESSFKQFHEQLHRKYDNQQLDSKNNKNGDEIIYKENVITDSSNGSSESDFPSNTSSSTTNNQQQHPYGQHLKLPQYPSTQYSQTISNIQPTYNNNNNNNNSQQPYSQPPPPQQQQSSYDFYDTFIPTFANNNLPNSPNTFPQQQPDNHHHSLNPLNNFFSSSNSNSKTNSYIDLTNTSENLPSTNQQQHQQHLPESNSISSLLNHHTNQQQQQQQQSQSHTRSSSTDLDTLAKQLNNPIYFEKLPSKAAQQQNNYFIKPRYPSNTLKNNKSSSSELVNNYLIGENSAINDHFTYEAPMIENKANEIQQQQEEKILQEKIEKNPLNNQIDNAFDANITLDPLPIKDANNVTNKEKDIIPPVVFQ
ncbi:SKG1 [Candida jiufengensis]|uniref:SKG1 n=1 Tax=Candida jiufengensis TaxID=497108 RepID=UPI00222505C6|nr:SKG1 [Candida jiufengensis]KAI5955081.1 SKG1 [Candida jiufengensis]